MSESRDAKFHPVHHLSIRVRYHEIDGQGRVHNSQYLNYFERGRVEMLRSNGISYRELEATGLMLVVKTMHVDFHFPAQFDDELQLVTTLRHCHGARIEHAYELTLLSPPATAEPHNTARSDRKIVSGHSIIACVDRDGKTRRLPKSLQLGFRKD
ncbi:MAG: thioesterase family protein [Pirellula sp.]